MHSNILHVLPVLILFSAVSAEIETVKIKVLRPNCSRKTCPQNVEFYYSRGLCSFKDTDRFSSLFQEGTMTVLSNTELTFQPPSQLTPIYDNEGTFVVVVIDGGTRITCCEDKSMRNSSGTHTFVHLQDTYISQPHYIFDLRVQTICDKHTYCTGFYCDDCEIPKLVATAADHAEVGGTTVLHCNVSAAAGLRSIYWQRYNSTTKTYSNVSTSDRFVGGNISFPSLTIKQLQKDDEGKYTCFARKGREIASSKAVYLNVIEEELVLMAWIKSPVQVRGTTVLLCNISSTSGVRSIYWQRYNSTTQMFNEVSISDRFKVGNASAPSLTILNVQLADEGNYTCFATNGRKTATSEAVYLHVIEVELVLMAWIKSPVQVGGTTVLHCNISSTSGVRSIYWQRYNSTTQMFNEVSISDRFKAGNTSAPSLTILNVQLADEGNYTCFATKGRKTASSEAVYLNVIEVTTQVSMTTDVSTLETETSITADITTSKTFHTTVVSGYEKTKSVSSTISPVIDGTTSSTVSPVMDSTTSSMTTLSMKSGTSVSSSNFFTTPSDLVTEKQIHNITITTIPSLKPTLITTQPTVAVHIGDKNSLLNASSHPTKLETTTCGNVWIGLTVALLVTAIILTVLVIYVIWLRKQTRSTLSNRMGSNWNGETPSYRLDHLSYHDVR